jgi:hypothetical protein
VLEVVVAAYLGLGAGGVEGQAWAEAFVFAQNAEAVGGEALRVEERRGSHAGPFSLADAPPRVTHTVCTRERRAPTRLIGSRGPQSPLARGVARSTDALSRAVNVRGSSERVLLGNNYCLHDLPAAIKSRALWQTRTTEHQA